MTVMNFVLFSKRKKTTTKICCCQPLSLLFLFVVNNIIVVCKSEHQMARVDLYFHLKNKSKVRYFSTQARSYKLIYKGREKLIDFSANRTQKRLATSN